MSQLLLLTLLLLSSMASMATTSSASEDSTDFVFAGCSQIKYDAGSPYRFNVDSLLTSLPNAAAFASYANFTSSASAAASPAYGLLQCRGDLPSADCQTCVGSALAQLPSLCPSAVGAAIQLRGCFLRYGNESFLGKPDTSVLYSKCGAADGGGYSSDLLAMRDTALADLTTGAAAAASGVPGGGGSFRVGAAGNVQAVGQCVGDQSAKQCDDCVAAAVAELRAVCGLAIAGEAYLGKCYARYWSNGIYSSKTNRGKGKLMALLAYVSPDDDDDKVGKTLAIIIGLIAGVALIIVFLSFLRRAARDDDKY